MALCTRLPRTPEESCRNIFYRRGAFTHATIAHDDVTSIFTGLEANEAVFDFTVGLDGR